MSPTWKRNKGNANTTHINRFYNEQKRAKYWGFGACLSSKTWGTVWWGQTNWRSSLEGYQKGGGWEDEAAWGWHWKTETRFGREIQGREGKGWYRGQKTSRGEPQKIGIREKTKKLISRQREKASRGWSSSS